MKIKYDKKTRLLGHADDLVKYRFVTADISKLMAIQSFILEIRVETYATVSIWLLFYQPEGCLFLCGCQRMAHTTPERVSFDSLPGLTQATLP